MLALEAFFDGVAATNSTERPSCPSLGPGASGMGLSECPRDRAPIHPYPIPLSRF
jgi:hypothetical protein